MECLLSFFSSQISCVASVILIPHCTQTAVKLTGLIISGLERATLPERYIFTSRGSSDVRYRGSTAGTRTSRFLGEHLNSLHIERGQQNPAPLLFHCAFSAHPICPSTVRRMTSGPRRCGETKHSLIIHIGVINPLNVPRCASMGCLSFRGSRRCLSQVKPPLSPPLVNRFPSALSMPSLPLSLCRAPWPGVEGTGLHAKWREAAAARSARALLCVHGWKFL